MNILEKARPENSFRCADGSVLGSVYELENRLCTMSSETFYHHANSHRNDFHNWIKDVFQDYELANELLSAKTPAQAAAVVRKHLRKALLAKEEIENAIQNISTAKASAKEVKPRPAKAAPRKKQQKHNKHKKQKKQKKTAAPAKKAKKNRKLNKNSRSNRKKKRGKSAHKRTKKQVNRWLNWLKIVPEL